MAEQWKAKLNHGLGESWHPNIWMMQCNINWHVQWVSTDIQQLLNNTDALSLSNPSLTLHSWCAFNVETLWTTFTLGGWSLHWGFLIGYTVIKWLLAGECIDLICPGCNRVTWIESRRARVSAIVESETQAFNRQFSIEQIHQNCCFDVSTKCNIKD